MQENLNVKILYMDIKTISDMISNAKISSEVKLYHLEYITVKLKQINEELSAQCVI